MSAQMDIADLLERAAEEIAARDINGWGNVCTGAAEYIRKLRDERDALREALQGMVRYVGIPTVLQDRPEFKAARAVLAKFDN